MSFAANLASLARNYGALCEFVKRLPAEAVKAARDYKIFNSRVGNLLGRSG